jgi:TonB family protein
LDFSSLIDKALLKSAAIVVPNDTRQLANKMGPIFNLADLDRRPQVLLQPEIRYPHELRQSGRSGLVVVEFIVDEEGIPRNPVATEGSDHEFEQAAMNGVLRWRFRPGMKGGAKVNTRTAAGTKPTGLRLTSIGGTQRSGIPAFFRLSNLAGNGCAPTVTA